MDIFKKIASRFRAIGFSSISAVLWLLVRRSPPPPFHFSGWLLLDLMIVVGALYGAAIIGTDALALMLMILAQFYHVFTDGYLQSKKITD